MNEVVEKLDQEPVAEPVVVDAADETGDASDHNAVEVTFKRVFQETKTNDFA